MSAGNTYFDQNRIGPQSDRRLHAADIERVGGQVQIVPAVAERLAPLAQTLNWPWSKRVLEEALKQATEEGDQRQCTNIRRQRWWVEQWSRKDGLYTVRKLQPAERQIRDEVLGPSGMPAGCFPTIQGEVADENDARIVAEVLAVGGRMIITSNMKSMDHIQLNAWVKANQNRFGWHMDRLLYEADELFSGWLETIEGRRAMTRSCLAAFWPEDEHASRTDIKYEVEDALGRLEEGHLPKFSRGILNYLERATDMERLLAEVRGNLPERMRQGERLLNAIMQGAEKDTNVRVERGTPEIRTFAQGYED